MQSDVLNIFYTDDDKDDQDIFKDAAQEVSNKLQVSTQATGDELIRLLEHSTPFPQMIFLDLNMPIKSGFEVLKELKGSTRTKDLPVIVFSTSSDERTIGMSRGLGANLYIVKPSSFSGLKDVISYSMSINWQTFTPADDSFVYRTN